MSADNVTNKRRADDWQQQPPTVSNSHVASWYEDEATAVIEGKGLAHVGAALHGAQTLTAILMQAAVSRDDDDGKLKLCGNVEQGLLAALSACLETVEYHTLTDGGIWTTRTSGEDERQTVSQAVRSIAAARYRKAAAGRGVA